MEENKNKNGLPGHPDGCKCGMCYAFCGGRHRILRAALLVILLALVFSFGVKFGENKVALRGGHHGYRGYPMMGGYGRMLPGGYSPYDYNQYPGMMRPGSGYYPPQTSSTSPQQ